VAPPPEPFTILKVECPVCGCINQYADIKPMAYRDTGSDTDFYPLGRVWQNPAYQSYDPLWFFMATCAKCFYTREWTPEFMGWAKDVNFKTYRQAAVRAKHLAAAAGQNGLVQFLGSHIDVEKYPAESAFIKFVLGIYDELTTDRTSSLNVGRYYLRTAWLFRSQATPADTHSPTQARLKRLRVMISDADQALRAYEHRVAGIKTVVESDVAPMLEDTTDAPLRDRAVEVMQDVSASIAALLRSQAELADMCDRVELAVRAEASTGSAFHTFASFGQFLLKAKELWPDVPVTEHEALRRACDYYRHAYDAGSDIKEGVGQVQAAYLIGELSRRIGDFATAERYFNTMLKVGGRVASSPTSNAATVNRTRKLLELGKEQARLNKEAQAGVGRDER
jgi:hypothetical protein